MEQLLQIIRIAGIDKTFEIMGLPAQLRRELKALERELGTDALMEALFGFLEGSALFNDKSPGPPTRKPPRPGPASAKPKAKANSGKRGGPKTDDPDDADDDNPDQLSLF